MVKLWKVKIRESGFQETKFPKDMRRDGEEGAAGIRTTAQVWVNLSQNPFRKHIGFTVSVLPAQALWNAILEGDRPNVRPLPAYNERDQERAFVAREPPVDLGPGDRYHTSRKPAPSAYPAERIEEAPRERKLDSNRFSGDVRKPPPADDAVKVHPSRLSMVLVPPPLDKGIESRLTDPESGNQSRAGGPVRIRRPNTKFGDSVNVVARLGPFSEDKDFVVDEHERRPQAARTSSLLERLNMASSGEPIPAPSLRERVDFPPNSRDNASAKEDSKDDVYFPDNGDDEGDSRRAPWKGRSRSNRPRRSRGRGPYGNV